MAKAVISRRSTKRKHVYVMHSVRTSSKILSVIGKKLGEPGVLLERKASVPTFTADPVEPKFVVRNLDGKKVRGRFVNGSFKVVRA